MPEVRISALIAPPFFDAWRKARGCACDELWLSGGRGSGKSSFVSLLIICGMMADPKANAIIYRKVGETLREAVYAQMAWAIDMLGVGCWFQLKLSPLEIVYLPTGQRIMFRGADKPEKSKGVKLQRGYFKYLWFEELTEFFGMQDIRTIKASVLRGTNKHTLTLYSYNPPMSALNWVNAESLLPRKGRLYHQSSYLDMPQDWLGDAFLLEAEALKQNNERQYRHMYLGEVTGTGGQVFDNIKLQEIPPEWESLQQYNGLDFGFATDPDSLVVVGYDKRTDTIFFLDEFCGTGNSTDFLAEQLIKRCKQELITADSADPRMIAELHRKGLNVKGAVKGPGSIEHGIRWLQSRSAIVIDPQRCPNAAREFKGYEYPLDRHGQYLSTFPDQDNHTIDAARYALERIARQGGQRQPLISIRG
jgi:PBSX family phage terminase large subunit